MISTIKNVSWVVTHAISVAWQLIRVGSVLNKVQTPAITIWGATQAKHDDLYTQKAFRFAQRCARSDIGILTGGGPGIMEAANCGAVSECTKKDGCKKITIGIGVTSVDITYKNPCALVTRVDYFLFVNGF